MVTRRDVNRFILGAGVCATCLAEETRAQADIVPGPNDRGPLDVSVLAVLMATAQTVTGVTDLQGYYEDYYDHQAKQHVGYNTLYGAYVKRVNNDAGRSGFKSFVTCDGAARAQIIGRVRGFIGGDRQFEKPIFQETLAIFGKTDAWLQLGYDAWPYSPRTVESYLKPLPHDT